ncbi:hypothetical protein ACQVPJ_29135 [Bacillus mycoides]|uniref:Uncharacterized protein n=1 Tax=Bacillus cereus VD021 TaxID=1053224 RepID=R8H2M5_BACCE|nr:MULTISPECIES: hypothetical protein [Bacillus cereus group]EEL03004.1 hypothetical protein bcere0014_54430 [Bacillus cereus BDRD-ST196]AIW83123.1 hypothetical protein bwei_0456 [Bacillus mycoides]EOO67041.1 hypothetical protein IIC_05302 [Bacillus cereus VD021]MCQ6569191.1 hypothetical protein [Bacillus mycoides]GAE39977.1 hypothetical protein BW1_022_00600 [Bacillus mycoides NBRC 101238 = DSM 11821]
MPNKHDVKEIYIAVRKDDGTYGKPMLLKPMNVEDLYSDSEGE